MTITTLLSCNSSKLKETSDTQFEGKWTLTERSMLNGIEIEITKDNEGSFKGVITKLNDNKYVQMFMSEGDKLVSKIDRKSNFEFEVSEKKIAAPLFSQYGQSTTEKFKATFETKDKIVLGKNGDDGYYTRIK